MNKQAKFVFKLWLNGEISAWMCLQQFLTYNHCGCSIPSWLAVHLCEVVTPKRVP